jgi:hypothetical protein
MDCSASARGDDHQPGGLIRDSAGNLYGVTGYGLAGQSGNVFELLPDGSGGWTYKSLHNFKYKSPEGTYPNQPILDAAGNLYGTTYEGGTGCPGCGIVYELIPNGNGGWREKILYNFQGDAVDGAAPTGPLTFDAAGNLYGTTAFGGAYNGGTVFELMRP